MFDATFSTVDGVKDVKELEEEMWQIFSFSKDPPQLVPEEHVNGLF